MRKPLTSALQEWMLTCVRHVSALDHTTLVQVVVPDALYEAMAREAGEPITWMGRPLDLQVIGRGGVAMIRRQSQEVPSTPVGSIGRPVATLDLEPGPIQRGESVAEVAHGHVLPRTDGAKVKCGGPGVCQTCSAELAAVQRNPPLSAHLGVAPGSTLDKLSQLDLREDQVRGLVSLAEEYGWKGQHDDLSLRGFFRRALQGWAGVEHSKANKPARCVWTFAGPSGERQCMLKPDHAGTHFYGPEGASCS